jgi:hypothetical protein
MSGRRLRAAALALTGACVGLVTWGAPARAADPPPAEGDPSAWVDEQVAKRQPTAEDRRLDEVGWAKDIRTAEKLAKDNGRLVFLFTHDGHMAVGRC